MGVIQPVSSAASGFHRVFAFLREQLLSGLLKPGDRLMPERELSVTLGVSRPTLREALRALSMLRVVETQHGAGTIVRRPDVSLLGDLFAFATAQDGSVVDDVVQARIAIECQAIRLACARAGRSDFERLHEALDSIAATIDTPDMGGLADHRFHAAIVTASGSATLRTLYDAIAEMMLRSHLHRRESIARMPSGRAYLIEHHRRVLNAVVAGDPGAADALLREHFAIGDEYRRRGITSLREDTPA